VHTAPSLEELQSNDELASAIFGRGAKCPPRRLALAFDRTYVVAATQLASTNKGYVLLGGPHRPSGFAAEDASQIVIKKRGQTEAEEILVQRNRPLASEIESCLVWDCTRHHSLTLEIGAFPVQSAAARDDRFESESDQAKKRGNWETLCRIGEILQACESVKHVIADSHGSHAWLALWLTGQPVPLSDHLKSLIPFFKDLTFIDLPIVCFPLGTRIAMKGNASIHFWSGIAHSQKNFVSQQRSNLGTIHYGNLWVDMCSALELGLFGVAYIGSDAMSDRQAALWFLD